MAYLQMAAFVGWWWLVAEGERAPLIRHMLSRLPALFMCEHNGGF